MLHLPVVALGVSWIGCECLPLLGSVKRRLDGAGWRPSREIFSPLRQPQPAACLRYRSLRLRRGSRPSRLPPRSSRPTHRFGRRCIPPSATHLGRQRLGKYDPPQKFCAPGSVPHGLLLDDGLRAVVVSDQHRQIGIVADAPPAAADHRATRRQVAVGGRIHHGEVRHGDCRSGRAGKACKRGLDGVPARRNAVEFDAPGALAVKLFERVSMTTPAASISSTLIGVPAMALDVPKPFRELRADRTAIHRLDDGDSQSANLPAGLFLRHRVPQGRRIREAVPKPRCETRRGRCEHTVHSRHRDQS